MIPGRESKLERQARAGQSMVHTGNRKVGSGVFVGVLHEGTSSLVQCNECNRGLGVFPGGY